MLRLEKYRDSSSRHTCPGCGRPRCFTRYIDTSSQQHVHEDCGRCDHESSCGYHSPPREHLRVDREITRTAWVPRSSSASSRAGFDFIDRARLIETLISYRDNGLVTFLFDLFPQEPKNVEATLAEYLIGTFPAFGGNYTCFPYMDQEGRFCKGKLIRYDSATGRRGKGIWDVHSLVPKLNLSKEFRYKQVFFGEHLLARYPERSVAIVESEKTALICSIVFRDGFVWLASGSKSWLTAERLVRVGRGRQVVLFPDADGFEKWAAVSEQAARLGVEVRLPDYIEAYGCEEDRNSKLDIADFLVREILETNAELGYSLSDLAITRAEEQAIRDEGCGLYKHIDESFLVFP